MILLCCYLVVIMKNEEGTGLIYRVQIRRKACENLIGVVTTLLSESGKRCIHFFKSGEHMLAILKVGNMSSLVVGCYRS